MEADINNRILRGHSFDACILIAQEAADVVIPALSARGIPTVFIGHEPSFPHISSVDVDNYLGAYMAASHLIGLGHQRIGAVLGRTELRETIERKREFLTAMIDAGLRIDQSLIAEGDYEQSFRYEVTERWMKRPKKPTGFFYGGDIMAFRLTRIASFGRNGSIRCTGCRLR